MSILILAIYNLGSAGQQISEDILNNIKKIDKNINIKVCVSLSCHLWPDVVVSSQRIAIENEKVEAEDYSLRTGLDTLRVEVDETPQYDEEGRKFYNVEVYIKGSNEVLEAYRIYSNNKIKRLD